MILGGSRGSKGACFVGYKKIRCHSPFSYLHNSTLFRVENRQRSYWEIRENLARTNEDPYIKVTLDGPLAEVWTGKRHDIVLFKISHKKQFTTLEVWESTSDRDINKYS